LFKHFTKGRRGDIRKDFLKKESRGRKGISTNAGGGTFGGLRERDNSTGRRHTGRRQIRKKKKASTKRLGVALKATPRMVWSSWVQKGVRA